MTVHAFDPNSESHGGVRTLCGRSTFGIAMPPSRRERVTCRECIAAFDRERADDAASEITYRSTGRGTYDVVETVNGRTVVLASIMFREGVKGRVRALEQFTAVIADVVQEIAP